MLSTVASFMVDGPTVRAVRIEVDVSRGLTGFSIVGMREASVTQVGERLRAAFRDWDFEFPQGRVIVNIAPASLRRAGAVLDLAMAAALLEASDQLHWPGIEGVAFLGGLTSDGSVRPVCDTGAVAEATAEAGVSTLVLPAASRRHAAPAGVEILYVENLLDLAHLSIGRRAPADRQAIRSRMRLSMAMVEETGARSPEVSCSGVAATFEVKLDPDLTLSFECHSSEVEYGGEDEYREVESRLISVSFEVRRVLCRRDGGRSHEVELIGEDREAAEALARRVIA